MTREEFILKLIPLAIERGKEWCAEDDTEEGHLNNFTTNLVAHNKVIRGVFGKQIGCEE